MPPKAEESAKVRMPLKKVPYFSTEDFTFDFVQGCVFTGVCQPGWVDSKSEGNTRKMQVRCNKGPMRGATFWIDWETEVTLVKEANT